MKKYILYIASERGFIALSHLIDIGCENIGCVVTFGEVNVEYDWSLEIQNCCISADIPCYLWKDVKNNLIYIIKKHSITSAVAISWRYLLPLELNDYLEDDLIVFHDSLLPKYRGFAPTPTAIICGEKVIGVTAIYATDKVDEGDIILQRSMDVCDDAYIQEIIKDQSIIYGEMLEKIIQMSIIGNLNAVPQNHTDATYSVWRNVEDCHINWEQPHTYLYNFIRAVGSPYPGAYTYMDEKKIIIKRAHKMDHDYKFAIRDCGKIWSIQDGMPIVICGSGLLKIQYATYTTGEKVCFDKVRCRLK